MLKFERQQKIYDCKFKSGDASRCRKEFFRDAQIKTILDKFCRTGVLDQPNFGRPTVVGDEYPGDLNESLALATAQRENGVFNHVEENEEKPKNEDKPKNEENNKTVDDESK